MLALGTVHTGYPRTRAQRTLTVWLGLLEGPGSASTRPKPQLLRTWTEAEDGPRSKSCSFLVSAFFLVRLPAVCLPVHT